MVKFGKITLTLAVLSDIAIIALNGLILAFTLFTFFSYWPSTNAQFFKAQSIKKSLGADYTKYMLMADMAVKTPEKMYDVEAQRQWFAEHVDAERYKTLKEVNPSYYPPPFCLACVPWLPLKFSQGLIIWSISQVLLLIVLLTRLIRKSPVEWIYFWIIALAGLGIRFGIILGQTAFLMASLTVALYYCWLKDRQLLAGFLLALAAIVKPHHCLVPFVMIIAKKQWKTFITFALTLLVIGAISVAFFGAPLVLGYPAALHRIEQEAVTHWQDYNASLEICVNVRSVLSYVLPGEVARQIGTIALLFDVVACYWIWRKSLKRGPQTFALAMVATTTLSMVCNLHTNSYDLTLLIFPCALALDAVGLYYSLAKDNVEYRLWCVSFPVLWTFSQIHCSFSSNAVNWHLLYLTLYAAWAFWFWTKAPAKSELTFVSDKSTH